MITKFLSSDRGHWMAKGIGKIQGAEFPTHGGLHIDAPWTLDRARDMSFEHRWRCGFYPWSDYTGNPRMRLAEFEFSKATESQLEAAFCILRRQWEGRRYNIGQALLMGRALLWARVGVVRKVPASRLGVCSEVLWCFQDLLGGEYQSRLRDCYPKRDSYGPLEDCAFSVAHGDLFWRRP